MMKIKGAIFDLDGTILDSVWVWRKVDIDFLGKYGFEVPADYSDKIMAMGFHQVAEYTIERFGLSKTAEEVMAEWNQMAMDMYATQVKLRPGTKELLQFLKEKGISAGVATSNCALLYEPCLRNNGIYEYFHSFTETEEVARGKDFPDIYIKAAEKLGCRPEECIVFEDIIPALQSARKGGFITIGVREKLWQHEDMLFVESCDYSIDEIYDAIPLINEME